MPVSYYATESRTLIEVADDGTIAALAQTDTPPSDATRLPGIVLPGFANAHSHAFHRALRGRTHGNGGTFWTWRETMYALAARLDPDSYYELARLVYAEMVLAGYTSVGEFHYLHHAPGGTPYARPQRDGQRPRRRRRRRRNPPDPARHLLPHRQYRHRTRWRATTFR